MELEKFVGYIIVNKPVSLEKLVDLIYLLQKAGVSLGCTFKYSDGVLVSPEVERMVDQLEAYGLITVNSVYHPTNNSADMYNYLLFNYDELNALYRVKYIADRVDTSDLTYLAVLDKVTQETMKNLGITKFAESKEYIQNIVKGLTGNTNPDDFDLGLRILRYISTGG